MSDAEQSTSLPWSLCCQFHSWNSFQCLLMLGLGLCLVQVLWYSTVKLVKMGNGEVKVGCTSFALLWSRVLFYWHQKQIKAIWIQNMCKESFHVSLLSLWQKCAFSGNGNKDLDVTLRLLKVTPGTWTRELSAVVQLAAHACAWLCHSSRYCSVIFVQP